MPCEPLSTRDGKVTGWICRRSREKQKQPRCYKCGKAATIFCDYRYLEVRHGHDAFGRPIITECPSIDTCDRPMCDECANHYGADTDFCDEHDNSFDRAMTERAEKAYQEQLKRFGISESDN